MVWTLPGIFCATGASAVARCHAYGLLDRFSGTNCVSLLLGGMVRNDLRSYENWNIPRFGVANSKSRASRASSCRIRQFKDFSSSYEPDRLPPYFPDLAGWLEAIIPNFPQGPVAVAHPKHDCHRTCSDASIAGARRPAGTVDIQSRSTGCPGTSGTAKRIGHADPRRHLGEGLPPTRPPPPPEEPICRCVP